MDHCDPASPICAVDPGLVVDPVPHAKCEQTGSARRLTIEATMQL